MLAVVRFGRTTAPSAFHWGGAVAKGPLIHRPIHKLLRTSHSGCLQKRRQRYLLVGEISNNRRRSGLLVSCWVIHLLKRAESPLMTRRERYQHFQASQG